MCTVKPVLTTTCEQWPPLNNGQPKPGQNKFPYNFHWITNTERPSMYDAHFFGVPRVILVDRFGCLFFLWVTCYHNISRNLSIYFDFVFSVTACIRRQEGYCCVQYQVCPDVISPFSLDTAITTAVIKAQVDTQCTNDYVTIPGSRLG